MSRSTVILSILVVGLLILAPTLADEKKVSEEAIARTRQTIKLLDDVHKG